MKSHIFYEQALVMARDFGEPVYISEKIRIVQEDEEREEHDDGSPKEPEEYFPWLVHVGRPATHRKSCWKVMPDGRLFLHEFVHGMVNFTFKDITSPEILGRYAQVRSRGKTKKKSDEGVA